MQGAAERRPHGAGLSGGSGGGVAVVGPGAACAGVDIHRRRERCHRVLAQGRPPGAHCSRAATGWRYQGGPCVAQLQVAAHVDIGRACTHAIATATAGRVVRRFFLLLAAGKLQSMRMVEGLNTGSDQCGT